MEHPRTRRSQYETKVVWSYFGGLILTITAVVMGLIAVIIAISVGVGMSKVEASKSVSHEKPAETKSVDTPVSNNSSKLSPSDFGLSREYLEMRRNNLEFGEIMDYSNSNLDPESIILINY